jgi:hypothetical protein
MENSITLTVEEQHQKFEELWETMDPETPVKGPVLFGACFGTDYNSKISGHKNAYSNLWNFLNRKVKEGSGYKSYADGKKATRFIKRDDANALNMVQKCVLTWNESVGKYIPRKDLIDNSKSAWQINMTPSYAGHIFKSLCEMGYGSLYKKGRNVFFSIDKQAPLQAAEKFLSEKKAKVDNRRAEVVKQGIELFNQQQKSEEIPAEVRMSGEEFLLWKSKYQGLKDALSQSRAELSECLDQLKCLQTENKLLNEKVTATEKQSAVSVDLSFLDD